MKKLVAKLHRLDVFCKKKVVLKSGQNSNLYIDIKKAFGDPNAFFMMRDGLCKIIDKRVTCIAAAGYGGLPLAVAVALKLKLKLVLVREKPKSHGRQNWIDGYVPTSQDKLAVIDDVFTSGTSLLQTLAVLKKTKTKIVGCYVVMDRSVGNIKFSMPIYSLVKLTDTMV